MPWWLWCAERVCETTLSGVWRLGWWSLPRTRFFFRLIMGTGARAGLGLGYGVGFRVSPVRIRLVEYNKGASTMQFLSRTFVAFTFWVAQSYAFPSLNKHLHFLKN